MNEKPSDSQLVQQCLDGDENAFEQLVERYQKQVFNAAYRLVDDSDQAQDISQSVFLKVYENLGTYDAGFKFYSWIYRITLNEALNALNKRRSFVTLDTVAEVHPSHRTGPDEAFERNELGGQIQRALMNLKTEHRTVIVLKHFLDCSYADMAQITGIPEKTVKSRLFTARRLLKESLVQRGVV